MELLENTGVWVKSRRAFQLRKEAGVRVDGLPCCVTGGGTFETMPAYLCGADLIDGIGACDNGMAVSLEMILTEDEIGQRILRICRGIRINEQTDLVNEIKAEGPGGAFLTHRSTLRNFRDKKGNTGGTHRRCVAGGCVSSHGQDLCRSRRRSGWFSNRMLKEGSYEVFL